MAIFAPVQTLTKNSILTKIEILEAVAEGKCIAKVNGQVIFVKGTAPGDLVDLKVIRKKKNYLEAIPLQFHHYSEIRQTPFCHHYGTCGGCKWQHIQYESQLTLKQQQVVDSLERIAGIRNPPVRAIIPSQKTTKYRNKLEFTFSNNRWLSDQEIQTGEELSRNGLGFHIPERFDRILDVEECHLQEDPSNSIRNGLRDFALKSGFSFYDLRKQTGLLRNLIIRNTSLGQIMVIVQFGSEDSESIPKVLEFLRQEYPQIDSLHYVVNTKGNDTFGDLDVIFCHGTPFIEEKINSPYNGEPVIFRIGPKSFFQTNSIQANRLFQVVVELADLQGEEIVYDLYSGTGTISILVAPKSNKVIGIESVPEAIEDAYHNSAVNGIANCRFIAGDIKDLLGVTLFAREGKPDVIITDPPRAGMQPQVLTQILNSGAPKIVYVSCNPATQARDIEVLSSKYRLKTSQPVDMFPHTYHVENVVLLELI